MAGLGPCDKVLAEVSNGPPSMNQVAWLDAGVRGGTSDVHELTPECVSKSVLLQLNTQSVPCMHSQKGRKLDSTGHCNDLRMSHMMSH
eukprot:6338187-Amphidinium_carterae.1